MHVITWWVLNSFCIAVTRTHLKSKIIISVFVRRGFWQNKNSTCGWTHLFWWCGGSSPYHWKPRVLCCFKIGNDSLQSWKAYLFNSKKRVLNLTRAGVVYLQMKALWKRQKSNSCALMGFLLVVFSLGWVGVFCLFFLPVSFKKKSQQLCPKVTRLRMKKERMRREDS